MDGRAGERTNERRMYDPLGSLSVPSLAFYPARSSPRLRSGSQWLTVLAALSLRCDSLLRASSGLQLLRYSARATRKAGILRVWKLRSKATSSALDAFCLDILLFSLRRAHRDKHGIVMLSDNSWAIIIDITVRAINNINSTL